MRAALSIILAVLSCLQVSAAQPSTPALPPIPPLEPSPLQQFRSWLTMSEEQRRNALAAWPENKRKVLIEKLRAYEILPQAQRDRRLNMLELRWYLRPLMRMTPEERTRLIDQVPVIIQPMVLDRLQAWDKLDAATRQELLENEETQELVMAYFAQIRRGIPQNQIFSALPPEKRERLQLAVARWNRTSLPERQRQAAQIAQFFELPREEQTRTLAALSPAEQVEIQRTLEAFARLPIEQRRACVSSFHKFASMPPEEKLSFLRNAARWNAMTPRERQTWKDLVTKLPPMPPEPDILPPMPGAAATSETGKSLGFVLFGNDADHPADSKLVGEHSELR